MSWLLLTTLLQPLPWHSMKSWKCIHHCWPPSRAYTTAGRTISCPMTAVSVWHRSQSLLDLSIVNRTPRMMSRLPPAFTPSSPSEMSLCSLVCHPSFNVVSVSLRWADCLLFTRTNCAALPYNWVNSLNTTHDDADVIDFLNVIAFRCTKIVNYAQRWPWPLFLLGKNEQMQPESLAAAFFICLPRNL